MMTKLRVFHFLLYPSIYSTVNSLLLHLENCIFQTTKTYIIVETSSIDFHKTFTVFFFEKPNIVFFASPKRINFVVPSC